ncbi:MAG: 30S ribosome-binding factor RbfA [Acidimicrobiia bacterium]|nr:30S ribosome-binding factor RbfA [Acidimicrobiia bacterium]
MPRPQRNAPRYPRTARVNELVRQIVAESLERVDDERLDLVAITQVVVDADLRHATVYYDALGGAEVDAAVLEAFGEQRVRLQAAIGRQARLKRTPELLFKADDVERTAGRVDDIIRGLHADEPDAPPA